MEDFEHIRKLIALKRYETPGDEYFEKFLEDFHERQRSEMLQVPTYRLVFDRIEAWVAGNRTKVWLGLSSAACAGCAALAVVLTAAFTQTPSEPVLLGAQLEPEETVPVVVNPLLREF